MLALVFLVLLLAFFIVFFRMAGSQKRNIRQQKDDIRKREKNEAAMLVKSAAIAKVSGQTVSEALEALKIEQAKKLLAKEAVRASRERNWSYFVMFLIAFFILVGWLSKHM